MLFNAAAEEAVLKGLLNHSSNALITLEGFDLKAGDFASEQNSHFYHLIKTYIEETTATTPIDISIIKFKSKAANLDLDFDFLETLAATSINLADLPEYSKSIKICALIRKVISRTSQLLNEQKALDQATPYDKLCKIVDHAYDDYTNILSNVNNNTFRHIYETIGDTMNNLIQGKKKVGLVCKKFPKWMQMIGGSFRRGSVNVISGFAKGGKSALSLAVAEDIASQGLPVLYIDTELQRDYQAERLIATRTGVPLKRVEYATFINNPDEEAKIKKELSQGQSQLPIYHYDASGLLLDDMLMALKRWIITQVGRDSNGNTKDCLIVFDYLKIASHKEYKLNIAEHQLIGMICTILHDLCRKYDVPIILAAQLNRQGEIGGSLRIDQLCSTRTSVAKKTPEELVLWSKYGNRKLSVNLSRFCDFNSDDVLHFDMSPINGQFTEFDFHHVVAKDYIIEQTKNKQLDNKKAGKKSKPMEIIN